MTDKRDRIATLKLEKKANERTQLKITENLKDRDHNSKMKVKLTNALNQRQIERQRR